MALGCAIGTILLSSVFCSLYWEGLGLIVFSSQPRDDGCSRCRRGVIERVAASSTGDRFYLCHCCGARYRRSSQGGLLDEDAFAPEYDRAFLRRDRGGNCKKAEPPIEEELLLDSDDRHLGLVQEVEGARSKLMSQTLRGWKGPEPVGPLWDHGNSIKGTLKACPKVHRLKSLRRLTGPSHATASDDDAASDDRHDRRGDTDHRVSQPFCTHRMTPVCLPFPIQGEVASV